MGAHQKCRGNNGSRLSWLQAALADVEQRFQSLAAHRPEREEGSYSLADKAENYYRKRPQLISLLQDLYHRYHTLADRYSHHLHLHLKPQPRHHHHHFSKPTHITTAHSDLDDADSSTVFTDATPDPPDSSDADSSLSFQPPPPTPPIQKTKRRTRHSSSDSLVAGIVTREIENAILKHEVSVLEKQQSESTRKVELQKSLLEVLESERKAMLGENERLGLAAVAVAEENVGLAAEAGFMRRKSGELARCVAKLREEHRVCVLGRKIEGLQAQIYGLEKRNKECYEVMARREEEKAEVVKGVLVEIERVKKENRRLREKMKRKGRRKRRGRRWWWWWWRWRGCFVVKGWE